MKRWIAWMMTVAACHAAEVSFDGIAARVDARNPALRAARWLVDEARGGHLGAGRLMNPELEVEFKSMTRGEPGGVEMMLMQKFPLTGRLRFEKQVTAAMIREAEAEVRDRRRMLVAEAEGIALRILATRRQIEIARGQAELAEEWAKVAAARVASEESALESGQMRLDATMQRSEIRELDAGVASMTEELKGMLGIAGAEGLRLSGTLPESLPRPAAAVVAGRPDVVAARWRATAAAQGEKLARSKRYDDLGVGLTSSYDRIDGGTGKQMKDAMIGVRLSVPIPWWNRNEGEVATSKAARARAEAEVAATLSKAEAEARAAAAEMAQLRPLVDDLREQVLPLAKRQVEQTRAAWGSGKARYDDLLRARDQWLRVETAVVNALRDYHLALVRWRAATSNH